MAGALKRKKTFGHRHREQNATWGWRQRSGWGVSKPRNREGAMKKIFGGGVALLTRPSYITQSAIRLWFEENLCFAQVSPVPRFSSPPFLGPQGLLGVVQPAGELQLLSLQALTWVHIQETGEGELHRHLSCQWNPFPQPGGHAVQRKEVEVAPARTGQRRISNLTFFESEFWSQLNGNSN